jgi:excinuclease ABC subunit A
MKSKIKNLELQPLDSQIPKASQNSQNSQNSENSQSSQSLDHLQRVQNSQILKDSQDPDSFQGIWVKGAREHNLKNITVGIPRNQFVVVTGLSGSGKSSLVFDTIFAEGQRRFLESMSTYTRYFMEQRKKPDVDSLSGLQPSIAIEQKTGSLNPRSTVGTVTEAYDYLRLLFAKKGTPFCPIHKVPAQAKDMETIVSESALFLKGEKFYVLSPVAQQKKGEFSKEILAWQKYGIAKAKIDGKWVELAQIKKLVKTKPHDIELVVEQLSDKLEMRPRFTHALKKATDLAKGQVILETLKGERVYYSLKSSCPLCGYSFPEIDPRFFSFNSPKGYCPDCKGLGIKGLEEEDVFDMQGDKKVIRSRKYTRITTSGLSQEGEEDPMLPMTSCPSCSGLRLRTESFHVILDGYNISDLSRLEILKLKQWCEDFLKKYDQDLVLKKILLELNDRLNYLCEVGCGYLSLNRSTDTLSGGEMQRLRLASQLGSQLTGVLYVLDEPSIGLHPRDHQKLIRILFRLRDLGNTILVVEHDEETIKCADYIIDIGPQAGVGGGYVVNEGSWDHVLSQDHSLTVEYLSLKKVVGELSTVTQSEWDQKSYIELVGARGHNLKEVTLKIPVGCLTSVTGVSGSGKSTLIMETLYPCVAKSLGLQSLESAPFDHVEGTAFFDKILEIDQRPIGRTSRSTPATYVDLAPLIREVFAQIPEAKVRGYGVNRFSYNSKQGQCVSCRGFGYQTLEMNFLSDVTVLCEDCQGQRFNQETLKIRFKNKNIGDIFAMTVAEAYEFFSFHPLLRRKLDMLMKVGLEYLQLGQGAPTLSGGEAQRIKLAKELSKRSTGKTLYILDEPTTGLHFHDVKLLIELLKDLVQGGNTVVVVEHNMDLVVSSDWIVELGPEGGAEGGNILFQGPLSVFATQVFCQSPTHSFVKTKFEQLLQHKK